MPVFQFALIVKTKLKSNEQILDATDALAEAGCLDASIRGHAEGMELLFSRKSRSLQAAIRSGLADVETAGFSVRRVELEPKSVLV